MRTTFRRIVCALGAVAAFGAGGAAYAAPVTYDAVNNPDESSFFAVDFGDGLRSAQISATNFTLQVDTASGEASFLSYDQQADPILLPGDISTGNITITTIPSESHGTVWDEGGNLRFSVTDTYLIYFEADLSAFGLTSPQEVVSTSDGLVQFGRAALGTISVDWAGEGQFGDPENPTYFDYICQVRTIIVPEPMSLATLALAGLVLAARRR